MKTKTIKLIEFYIQINEESAERLIAEGRNQGFWRRLYKFLKEAPAFIWCQSTPKRSSLLVSILSNENEEFTNWVNELLKEDCWVILATEPVFIQGTVEEIVN